MVRFAVIKSGGKQYLVKEKDEFYVDRLEGKEKDKIELETLAVFDDNQALELGTPFLKDKVKTEIIEHVKGDKIRVAHFKSKVRYRKVKGFRPYLTKIKIEKIV